MKQFIKNLPIILVALTVFASFHNMMPRKLADSALSTEFSSKRVASHIKEISKEAHYLGSEENTRVREYLIEQLEKLGLQVEVQTQSVFTNYRSGAKVNNIIARIKGTEKGKALVLSAHYDSDTNKSKGASDDGIGICTILEGVRAYLASGQKPKNDIIILFTDGEEIGLMGAYAFTKYHPWAKDVGLSLNFEARGSGGPSYMQIETLGGNKNFIKHFRKAGTDYPLATSLMYDISKTMPNSTDLKAFNETLNVTGFNFSSIGDHFDYHTEQDSYERMDMHTIEHQGSYLMPLLKYFANIDLSNLESDEDFVFFNFPVLGFVFYPYSWIVPMLILICLAFFGLVFFGIRRNELNLMEILKGFVPFLLSLILVGGITKLAWESLKLVHPQYFDIQQGFTYNGYTYIIAFSALSIAICISVYKKLFSALKTENLLIAPVFMWILVSGILSFTFQGGAYFIVNGFIGLLILCIFFFSKLKQEHKTLLISVLSLPIIIIFVPNIQTLPVGLGLDLLFAASLLIAALFGLMLPVFREYCEMRFGLAFYAMAMVGLLTASLQSSYTVDRKKPNGVNYVLDTEVNKAFWGSYDYSPDEYTKQFLGDKPKLRTSSWGYMLKQDAELKPITEPLITVLSDTVQNDLRMLNFDILSLRNGRLFQLYANNDMNIKKAVVNGIQLKDKSGNNWEAKLKKYNYIFSYNFAYQDSVMNVQLTIPKSDTAAFVLFETSYDLLEDPNFDITPRTECMMPNSYPGSIDCIVLRKVFGIDSNN